MDKNSTYCLGQLHYHFKQCGVRTVIENICSALIRCPQLDRLKIDLISADAQGLHGREIADHLRLLAAMDRKKQVAINTIEIHHLAYNQQPSRDKTSLLNKADRLAAKLLQHLNLGQFTHGSPYILHIHNANIGKNPTLTLAIKRLANKIDREKLPLRIIYQMHDFAEDHRPDCWHNLLTCSGRPDHQFAMDMMYPANTCVRWICINSKDREKLIGMHIPADTVTITPNAVNTDALLQNPLSKMDCDQLQQLNLTKTDFTADLKSRITEFADNNGFQFDPARKILLAPVKTIRRKNILESILLLMMLNQHNDSHQLLVTLRAHSSDDMDYCTSIENFVRDHRLPVVIGFGEQCIAGLNRRIHNRSVEAYSLIDLFDLCEAVVTTSIQEGFGYIFHEPWLAGKPVIGRDIPDVTRDFINSGMDLTHLYRYLLIPRDWLGKNWENLCRIYVEKYRRLRDAVNLPVPDETQLQQDFGNAKTHYLHDNPLPRIDWADLSVELQLSILKDLTNRKNLLEQVHAADCRYRPLPSWPNPIRSDIIERNKKSIITHYSLESLAQKWLNVYQSPLSALKDHQNPSIDNTNILKQAYSLDEIRLIR